MQIESASRDIRFIDTGRLVELAKQYSTEQSGGFVNGVLGTIAAQVRPADG